MVATPQQSSVIERRLSEPKPFVGLLNQQSGYFFADAGHQCCRLRRIPKWACLIRDQQGRQRRIDNAAGRQLCSYGKQSDCKQRGKLCRTTAASSSASTAPVVSNTEYPPTGGRAFFDWLVGVLDTSQSCNGHQHPAITFKLYVPAVGPAVEARHCLGAGCLVCLPAQRLLWGAP